MPTLDGRNLAASYAEQIDERFTVGSQVGPAVNHNYKFKGDRTVKVYSYPTAPLNDYSRSGSSRYGTPMDVLRNVQTMNVDQDKAFSFVIDKGDLIQSEMNNTAAESLKREIDEVIVPAFDGYVLARMASSAIANGSYASSTITKTNAFTAFLDAYQYLGNHNVPVSGRFLFCSYGYLGLIMQDSNFIKASDTAQKQMYSGYVGTIFGVPVIVCDNRRLPSGCAFILVHREACTAPKQLNDCRVHTDPPGVSGSLVEGRFIFDAFVLNEKADGIYYHGGQAGLKNLFIVTAPSGTNKVMLNVNDLKESPTNKWYAKTATTKSGLPAVTYNTAIDVTDEDSPWYGATELTAASTDFSFTSGHTFVRVVELASNNKPVAVADRNLPVADS